MRLILTILVIILPLTAMAVEVVLPYRGIKLLGNLEIAPKRSIQDGVIVMVHDSLLTHHQDTINILQMKLAERGLNSLAITLSLSFSARDSALTCADSQLHKHTDAVLELRAWHEWLVNNRAGPLIFLGHGRGANQALWYAHEAQNNSRKSDIVGLILLAPMTYYPETIAKAYLQHFGRELADEFDWIAKSEGMIRNIAFLGCESTNVHSQTFVSYYQNDSRKHTPWLLSKTEMPALVALAENDQIEPNLLAEMGKNPQRNLIWRNADIVVIPNADHNFADDGLIQLVQRIDEFMLGRFERYTHFYNLNPN